MSPQEHDESSAPSDAVPWLVFPALIVIGAGLLAVLFLASVPRVTLRSFLWGVGTGFIFSGMIGLVFPETRTWRPRTKLPFTSRLQCLLFFLTLLIGSFAIAYYPAARVFRWWPF